MGQWTKKVSSSGGTTNVTISQGVIPFNYYNVLSNGLVGDGITDDSLKLQALVNSVASAGGGTIYAPKRTYLILSEITWASNVSLIGDGKDLTVFKKGGTSPYGLFTQADATTNKKNIFFKDFTIDGYGVTLSAFSVHDKGFQFQNVTNATFRDIEIKGTNASGLGIDFLQDVLIHNVTCTDCGRYWQPNQSMTGSAGIGIGTGYQTIENLTISHCKTYNCGQFGIFLELQSLFGQGSTTGKGITIDNCLVKGGKNHGFGIRGGENVTLNNCQSYENTAYGIYLDYTNFNKIKVSNNTVSENVAGGIGVYGNAVITDLMIDNNMISNNTGDGISLFKDTNNSATLVKNLSVINNHITGNTGNDIYKGTKNDTTTWTIKNNITFGNGTNSTGI